MAYFLAEKMKVGSGRGGQSQQVSVEQLKAVKKTLMTVMMAIICLLIMAATIEVSLHLFLCIQHTGQVGL